ncbi:MAG: abortive infection system antitoxin AbiGi family protein [Candidatus Poribacteria bacterium]|nr:abortive infection system antitoxin AbiGi family protein [Candidatus Poribacteria bacterium]
MRDKRSDYVIHWTGKDIDVAHRLNPAVRRQAYIDRLQRTLRGDPDHYPSDQEDAPKDQREAMPGLWMTWTTESLHGQRNATIQNIVMPATCFTELPLTSARGHTTRYGCMGFGFTRRFVMERRGNPVLYVAGKPSYDVIIQNIRGAMDMFEALENAEMQAQQQTQPPSDFDLDDALRVLRDGIGDPQLQQTFEHLERWLRANPRIRINTRQYPNWTNAEAFFNHKIGMWLVAAFLKNMSQCPDDEDMTYLNEMEWRIVHSHPAENDGLLRQTQHMRDALETGRPGPNPPCKIPFDACQLKVLVFPDSETKQTAMNNPSIFEWFRLSTGEMRYPIILTIDELEAI